MEYRPHKMGDHSDDPEDRRPCDCDRPAAIGHNLPPDPFEAFKLDLESLYEEAGNFLDGEPIANQAQADDVSALLNRLRKSIGGAEEARKAEKKPHDDMSAAVQKKWVPVIDSAKLAAETAKKALASFLVSQDEAQRAAAQAAFEEARKQAEAAAQTAQVANPDSLADQTAVRVRQENAAAALKLAQKLDKARPQARGGERAVGLKTRFTAILTDPVAALKHYRERQPEALKEWLAEQGQRDVRAGAREIPGFTIEPVKGAV